MKPCLTVNGAVMTMTTKANIYSTIEKITRNNSKKKKLLYYTI